MSRHRKCFFHGCVYELTFRSEEGLPLVAAPYMRLILESYLARAQERYFVRIVALMVMGNHVHLLIVVEDPEAVPDFMEYFKRETAIAINKLLGRERRTVWEEGYDSPIVLDAEKVIERLVYFYSNPQRARLVNTIDDYPNLSTWSAFLFGGTLKRNIPTFPRTAVPVIQGKETRELAKSVYRAILEEKNGEAELMLEPFAWLGCFPDTEGQSPELVIEQVVSQVRSKEHLFCMQDGESVLGAEALRQQSIRKAHDPKKRGNALALECF